MKSKQYSLWSIVFIFAFIVSTFFYFQVWKKNRIIVDAPSYYAYLPAVFIHHDLKMNFIDRDRDFYKDKIWYYKIENGNKLIKCPAGVSLALLPFFMAGHLIAGWMDIPQTGYTMPYQNAMSLGVLLYLFIGLLYLRKLLLAHFSEGISALTIITLVLGTNLLWYSTFEGFMSHGISFSLLCICMYLFDRWLREGHLRPLLVFSALFGILVLIRPLAITILLYFLIVGIYSKGGFRVFLRFLRAQLKNVAIAIVVFLPFLCIQPLYWKYITGHWYYDVYIDEHFIFSSPAIFLFLFSFRKGIFIYTPVLVFAVVGLVALYRRQRGIVVATLSVMLLTVFILSSWWAWSYGISWGIRPMVDYYSLLAIPMAAGLSFFMEKGRLIKVITAAVLFLLIALNLFQTWQYKNGLIHYDDMTREAYFKGFFQTKRSAEWMDLLKPYDWERRIKGLPQVDYSKEYFESSFEKYPVELRGFNLQYAAINPKAQNAVAAYAKSSTGYSLFRVKRLSSGTVALVAANGRFLSVTPQYDNVLMANALSPGPMEQFEISYLEDGDNRISLRSIGTGKYVMVSPEFPNMLLAAAGTASQKEIFRLFVLENTPINQ